MIVIRDVEHFRSCVAHARAVGAWDNEGGLRDCLRRLSNAHNWCMSPGFARRQGVKLFKDFAPFSWDFVVYNVMEDGAEKFVYNGGLIYFGPNEDGVSGPQFSVNLSPSDKAGWRIHT